MSSVSIPTRLITSASKQKKEMQPKSKPKYNINIRILSSKQLRWQIQSEGKKEDYKGREAEINCNRKI